MDCQNEDYQLLLNNIVQLLKTDWKLAVVLMEGQGITVNEIPFEGIVEDVINGEFIINGLSVTSSDIRHISIRASGQFDGRGFDKSAYHLNRTCKNWYRTYPIHDFKYRMTNYLYQNLKNTTNDRIK